jgi:RNA polymerase sigma-70 factor (ECF subfamily)
MDDWKEAFSQVKAALRRRGNSTHDAEDMVQEAFVRLTCYEHAQSVANPDAFLMRTALNLSNDAFRARRVRGEEVLVEDEVVLDTAPGLEDMLLSRERMARMNKCLSRLSAKTRAIFLAHRVDGLSYQAIARIHGISISSVEKHVAKALLLVTGWMEGWYP